MSDEPNADGRTITLGEKDWRGLVASVIEVYQRRFIEPRTALHESILGMRRRLDVLIPRGAWGDYEPAPAIGEVRPVDMLLFCPNCGEQHVDVAKPGVCETCGQAEADCPCTTFTAWLNPAHKTHRCGFCNHKWRPADVPTNGVVTIKTRGEGDGNPRPRYYATAADFERAVGGRKG